jgi:membrane-bound lytic murein transglycosylase D
MRSIVLAVALLLPGTAFAGRWKDRRAAREAAAQQAGDATPAPVDGSLWDYIEGGDGTPGAESPVAPTEELATERNLEASFMTHEALRAGPIDAYYADPLATLSPDPLHLSSVDPREFDIPVVINDDVVKWMRYFTGPGRKYYARWLERSTRFRPMMYEKLEAAGLPRDLVYLSMIESGYSTGATSTAAAVGLWQFIPPTGREWKLRIDGSIDERRDPEMATDAAIGFLGYLNRRYDSWHLAWAAYNGGPGRVDRAVARHGTKDFWSLVDAGAFPDETDNYVPKLIAAAIIGHHPERYGFTDIAYQPRLDYDSVVVEPGVGVDVLAECAGISVAEFTELNPHIRRSYLPPDGRSVKVRVPRERGGAFLAAVASIPPEERITFVTHKVKKGETLGTIASRYGVSTADLQKANRITNANRISVGAVLTIPKAMRGGGGSRSASSAGDAIADAGDATETRSPAPEKVTAKVEKPAPPRALTNTAAPAPSKQAKSITHTVRKGEGLSTIAEKYGVKQSDLMRWNNLSNANRIQAGQKLRVVTSSSAWATHTVRKGDTLSEIAARYGCSVADIKSWNSLGGSTIQPGQSLRIKK